jgi:hypothetical protein
MYLDGIDPFLGRANVFPLVRFAFARGDGRLACRHEQTQTALEIGFFLANEKRIAPLAIKSLIIASRDDISALTFPGAKCTSVPRKSMLN